MNKKLEVVKNVVVSVAKNTILDPGTMTVVVVTGVCKKYVGLNWVRSAVIGFGAGTAVNATIAGVKKYRHKKAEKAAVEREMKSTGEAAKWAATTSESE